MMVQAAAQTASAPPPAAASGAVAPASGDSGFFANLLDVINPLQHIPVVGTLYRAITGDTIQPLEQLAGDALYGGVLGFVASAANLVFKDITGKDVGDTVLAFAENLGGSAKGAAVASNMEPNAAPLASGPPRQLIGARLAAAEPALATAAAAAAPAAVMPAQATDLSPLLANADGFVAALKSKTVDPTLALRALYAYQKTLDLKTAPAH
ncbi:MAG: hypothetical protein KGL26_00650 [Pseudomonadota bacterium]|nr:hypothetical protein [Pseudomonadota bacterium]